MGEPAAGDHPQLAPSLGRQQLVVGLAVVSLCLTGVEACAFFIRLPSELPTLAALAAIPVPMAGLWLLIRLLGPLPPVGG